MDGFGPNKLRPKGVWTWPKLIMLWAGPNPLGLGLGQIQTHPLIETWLKTMGQEYTRIHTFSVGNWPKGVNPCIFPLIYPYQWKCTRIHTFWPKGVNPCTFLTHTLWTRNVQGFTHFQIKCQKPSKMKRCESLYIPGPYLMGGEYTRIHTFSGDFKDFAFLLSFYRDGNLQGFTPFQNLIVESLVRKWPYSWCLIYFITSSDLT